VNRIAQVPVLLLCPVWALAAQVSASPPVSVFVADEASSVPLVDAHVEFPSLGLSQNTDPFGVAYFRSVKSGVVRIKVAKIGYEPVERDVSLEFPSANAIELSVAMKSLVVSQPLDTVKVIGKRTYFDLFSGFEHRRQLGLGKYLTSAQLDSSPHEFLADLITRRLPGVRAQWDYRRAGVRIVSLRGPIKISGESECLVQVYVDNEKGGDLTRLQSGDVAGVEYYPIAPPAQYSSNAPCGVLLVWTKR